MVRVWNVVIVKPLASWIEQQEDNLIEKILASLNALSMAGPNLARPYSDTLYGSKIKNLKELRIQYKGHPYRLFYFFDSARNAIVLCGGCKKGINEKDFYTNMIGIAEQRYLDYINSY